MGSGKTPVASGDRMLLAKAHVDEKLTRATGVLAILRLKFS